MTVCTERSGTIMLTGATRGVGEAAARRPAGGRGRLIRHRPRPEQDVARTTFLREFLRDPLTVAAVTPSGRLLAELVTATVPRTGDPLVVELGAGTGAFTAAIQRRLAGRGHHLAIEMNARFAAGLTDRFPRATVAMADARELGDILAQRGHGRADVMVSGLPWAAFAPDHQDDLLDTLVGNLAPDGAFTTFAYLHARWAPPARRLRRVLRSRFEEVVVGRTVWANLPPAFVYYCRRPQPPPTGEAVVRRPGS